MVFRLYFDFCLLCLFHNLFVMRIGIELVICGMVILLTLSNCFSSSVLIFFCCVSFRSGGRDFHIRCCELTLRIKGGGQELGYSYSLNISLLTFMSAHCQDSWYHFAFNVYIYKCCLPLSVMVLYLFHLWIIQTLMWNFKKNSNFVLHWTLGEGQQQEWVCVW